MGTAVGSGAWRSWPLPWGLKGVVKVVSMMAVRGGSAGGGAARQGRTDPTRRRAAAKRVEKGMAFLLGSMVQGLSWRKANLGTRGIANYFPTATPASFSSEELAYIASTVEHSNNLDRLALGTIRNQVGIDAPEAEGFIRDVLSN